MADPHVEEESTSISMVVEDWADDEVEQFSPIHRIGGYPWRLYLLEHEQISNVYVICDKSSEAELWHCTATITSSAFYIRPVTQIFTSWDKNSQKRYLGWIPHVNDYILTVNIAVKDDGNSWRIRPTPGPFDRILLIGEDEMMIPVNTDALASQSSFFDRLFNGDFKEKKLIEIFIGDVEYEEFSNIIEMVYGSDGPSLTEDNVYRFLELADRFDLKIIEDKVVSFLLSSSSYLTIHRKLLISDQFNLPFLKDNVLKRYSKAQMIDLINLTEFDQLSHDYLRVLFNKYSIDAFNVSLSTRMSRQISQIPVSFTPCEKNESNRISMTVKNFDYGSIEQFSSVHRISGFPWRLCTMKSPSFKDSFENSMEREYCADVLLICDKSDEAELWKCTATISTNFGCFESKLFASWDKNSHILLADSQISVGDVLEVHIATDDDGESYYNNPSLDPHEPCDAILVFENRKTKKRRKSEKKIEVNKKSLSLQSPYFDSLFFGNSKNKDKNEFPLANVDYEEFSTIMALLYGDDDNATVNCDNAERMLQLANRFELKFVEDKVVSFLISTSSSDISLPKKLLFSDQYNLPLLKDALLSQFESASDLTELSESLEWNKLSKKTLRVLFKMFCR